MKLVILDRDGVINEDSDAYIKSADEWRPIAGSLEAIARLKAAGFTVAIATNQSGIGRGLYDYAALAAIHAKMRQLLAAHAGTVDGIFFCPHTPRDHCDCRKPAPGLLWQIGRHFDTPLRAVPVIGDSSRDLEAARRVGATPMLVLTGNGSKTTHNEPAALPRYADLAAAVTAIIAGPGEQPE